MEAMTRLQRRLDRPEVGAGRNGHHEPRRRNRRALYAIGVLVAAVVVFFALNAVYGWTNSSATTGGSRLTATVKRGTVQSSVSASGNVSVAKSASASFATSGTITAVYVRANQHVKVGQALAKIDPTSARNALASAKANLATAESTLASAKGGLTTAQRDANTISVQQAQQSVTTDEQQLATDEQTLATARQQLARDAKLGFPASSSSSTNASTGAADDSTGAGSSSTGASTNSTGTGSSSTGASTNSTGTGSNSTGTGSNSTGSGSTPTHAVDDVSTDAESPAVTGGSGASGATGQTASSGSASAVGTSTATLNGTVSPGGLDTTYYFEYGTSPTSLGSTTPTADAGSGSGSVPVSATVTGLQPNQSYYFELVTTNSSGTTDSSLGTFTTSSATPVVTTGQASAVSTASASLSGTVQPQGLSTSYYFEYGTSATSLGSHTTSVNVGSGTGSVPATATVTGLTAGQTYYFALVATNSSGTADGALALFTTSAASASAATGAASAIGSTTATLSGSVNPGTLDTSEHFQYGTSAAKLDSSTSKFDVGSGSGSVSVTATLHSLKPDTTYWFRLVASNSSGTSYGVEETFTTSAAAKPTVDTGSASAALTTSVTLAGTVNPEGSDAKYWFEYGTSSSYGSKTAAVSAGAGTTASEVTATVKGLQPDTEYLFRLVATNRFGTSTGLSEVVTTPASSRTADEQAVTSDEQTVEHQRQTVTTAKESLAETEASIASSETPSTATIEQDEATVSEDEATVSADQQALDETVLRAPIAGVVTTVNASVGETASAGSSTVTSASTTSSSSSTSSSTGGGGLGSGASDESGNSGSSSSGSSLFTIDSLGQLEIVAGFAEADATNIAVGQPVTITFPALTNVEVAGKVVAVSLTSTVVSDVVTYDETIALVNPPSSVKDGMTADAAVIDQTASNVLYVPSAAITTTGTRSTVEVLKNGKETETPVTTGLVGNSDTQITSGLTAGEVLVEPTVSIASTGATSSSTTGGGGGFAGLGGGGGGRFFGGGGLGG